jgi:excisionase family DNA binding protein
MEQPLHSVPEAARLLGGLSRWTLYQWLSSGKIAGVKVGSRIMVSGAEIERIVVEGTKKHATKRSSRQ